MVVEPLEPEQLTLIERCLAPLGEVVAIENRFGASAPGKVVMEKYGFSAAQVVERARALLAAFPARAKALSTSLGNR